MMIVQIVLIGGFLQIQKNQSTVNEKLFLTLMFFFLRKFLKCYFIIYKLSYTFGWFKLISCK